MQATLPIATKQATQFVSNKLQGNVKEKVYELDFISSKRLSFSIH